MNIKTANKIEECRSFIKEMLSTSFYNWTFDDAKSQPVKMTKYRLDLKTDELKDYADECKRNGKYQESLNSYIDIFKVFRHSPFSVSLKYVKGLVELLVASNLFEDAYYVAVFFASLDATCSTSDGFLNKLFFDNTVNGFKRLVQIKNDDLVISVLKNYASRSSCAENYTFVTNETDVLENISSLVRIISEEEANIPVHKEETCVTKEVDNSVQFESVVVINSKATESHDDVAKLEEERNNHLQTVLREIESLSWRITYLRDDISRTETAMRKENESRLKVENEIKSANKSKKKFKALLVLGIFLFVYGIPLIIISGVQIRRRNNFCTEAGARILQIEQKIEGYRNQIAEKKSELASLLDEVDRLKNEIKA